MAKLRIKNNFKKVEELVEEEVVENKIEKPFFPEYAVLNFKE